MELFKNTNFDFLGKKWPFIIASLVLTVAGFVSIAAEGRAQVRHRLQGRRADDGQVRRSARRSSKIRSAMSHAQIKGEVTRAELHRRRRRERSGDRHRSSRKRRSSTSTAQAMEDVLTTTFGQPGGGKLDFNNASQQALVERLRDPLARGRRAP